MTMQPEAVIEGRRPKWAVTPWPWADQAVGATTAGVFALGLLSATFVGQGGGTTVGDLGAPLTRSGGAAVAEVEMTEPLRAILAAPALSGAPVSTTSFGSPRTASGPATAAPAPAAPAPASPASAPPASPLQPAPSSATAPAPIAPVAPPAAPTITIPPLGPAPAAAGGQQEAPEEGVLDTTPTTVPPAVESLVAGAVSALKP